jgi:HK97 family phage major capsid protein
VIHRSPFGCRTTAPFALSERAHPKEPIMSHLFGKSIKALRQERADLRVKVEQLLSAAEASGTDLTDEQRAAIDAAQARLEIVSADLDRYEKSRGAERAASRSEDELAAVTRAGGDPRCGFANVADFARAVQAASAQGHRVVDERLGRMYGAPTGFHETAGGNGEGYLVPPQFRSEVWDAVFADDDSIDLLNLVSPEPTSSNAVDLLADETTPWGSTGVQAYWRAEAGLMTPTKALVDPRSVKLHELYAFVLSTQELLSDAPRLRSRLTTKSALAIRWKASVALMRGTGAGQPMGWLNSAATVSVAKESGQAADTFVVDNAAKMYSRMMAGAIGQSRWLMNIDVFPQLGKMTIGDQPVWTPPVSGIREAPGGFLYGRPITWSEHCSTIGDVGDVQFVAPGPGYFATTKEGEGVQFAESMHLYFDYGVNAFRWTFRIGGQPYLSAPVTPFKGSNTKSHFVTLADRA